MKYLKYFENNYDIDPFDEEDWDEIDKYVVKEYEKKWKNKKIKLLDIPENILKTFKYELFKMLKHDNPNNIIEQSIKIFNILKDELDNQILFEQIIYNIKNKKKLLTLLKNRQYINNFDELLKNNVYKILNEINDIDKEIINLLLKNINIYELLNDDYLNLNGETLYKIIKQIEPDFYLDLEKLDYESFEHDSIIYLIGRLYIDKKVNKNSFSLLCAYKIDNKYYNEFMKKIRAHKKNNEIFITFNNFNDLKNYYNQKNYIIDFENHWELFIYDDYKPDWNDFTYYINVNGANYLGNLLNEHVNDFLYEDTKNMTSEKFNKYINYINNFISDGYNEEYDNSKFNFSELINAIKLSLSDAQSYADANEYFNRLINELSKIFNYWNDGKIYKWIKINNEYLLCLKPNIDFIEDINFYDLIYNYGLYFDIYDLINYVTEIKGLLEPNLEYIYGEISKEQFNDILIDKIEEIFQF